MKPTRTPAFAGRFYPGDEDALSTMVRDFLGERSPRPAVGVVAPHAGYVYSGAVAGATLATVEIPETALILCPKHTRYGRETAIMLEGSWDLPGGPMAIDEPLARHLHEALPGVEIDAEAHRQEHAVEVILPFLRECRPDVRFVPLALGFRSLERCTALGQALGHALQNWPSPVLIVSSSDMNHFEDQTTTLEKDQKAIERYMAFDPDGLYNTCREHNISMCGVVPTTIMLIAAKMLDGKTPELICHATSADVSGDTTRVVGYAGMTLR